MTQFLKSYASLALIVTFSVVGLSAVGSDALRCPNITLAQVAPKQDGVLEQKWCCCGACCGWAVDCGAIPGCSTC